MPEYPINDLEEQLRQDRRLGKARRRKRRLKKLLPFLILLAAVAVVVLAFRLGRHEEETEPSPSYAPGSSVVTMNFVGDISLDEPMMERFRNGSDYDFSPLLRRIIPRLAAADLTVGNLEGNVSSGAVSNGVYPPALLRDLYAAGFDLLQTSNSYSIQNGLTGLAETKNAIQAAGMDALGTWTSFEDRAENGVLIREVNGMRIAFLAFTKGMNSLRLPEGTDYCVNLLYTDYDTTYTKIARTAIADAVMEARLQEPDLIVAMVHWGSEYDKNIADSQKEIARLLFENGVHLIVGSHSHFVSAMELNSKTVTPYGGNFVAYSLGDFVSTADTSTARNGCVLSVTVCKDEEGTRITELRYFPTYSAAPDEALGTRDYEVLDTLDAISFYQNGYYDSVSDTLYEKLVSAVEKMKEQTGLEP